MIVRALVRVIGLQPGQEADVDPQDPGVRAALTAELVEEVWLAPAGVDDAVGRRSASGT